MNLKDLYNKVDSNGRAIASCHDLGITVKFHKNLDRVSNTRWHNGMLSDGTLHYTRRTEVSGNTYAVKDLLKKWGARWDAGRKCWWFPATKADSPTVAKRLLKVGSKRNLFA